MPRTFREELISLIATADQAQENIFDYLQALQKNKSHVKLNPADWPPWTYRETLEMLKKNQHQEVLFDSS